MSYTLPISNGGEALLKQAMSRQAGADRWHSQSTCWGTSAPTVKPGSAAVFGVEGATGGIFSTQYAPLRISEDSSESSGDEVANRYHRSVLLDRRPTSQPTLARNTNGLSTISWNVSRTSRDSYCERLRILLLYFAVQPLHRNNQYNTRPVAFREMNVNSTNVHEDASGRPLTGECRASPLIPAKRSAGGEDKSCSTFSLLDKEDDELPNERPPKRGKAMNEGSENEIPCTCHMTGLPEYRNCTKRHKYLSHLARHLYSHDIYVCQMCFTRFDGHGKEENSRRKQDHRCVKACSDGLCKRRRHWTEDDSAVSVMTTCNHLVTWQDRWIELYRTQFPTLDVPRLNTMTLDGARSPKTKSRQNSHAELDTSSGFTHDEESHQERISVPRVTVEQHHMVDAASTSQPLAGCSTGHSTGNAKHQQRHPMINHTSNPTEHAASPMSGESVDATYATGSTVERHDLPRPWSRPFDDAKLVLVRGNDAMVENLTHRIDSLSSALRRSLTREKELNSELTALRRRSAQLGTSRGSAEA